jgi:hypothetical protein
MAEWITLAEAIAVHVRDVDPGWTIQFAECRELRVPRDLKGRTVAARGVQGETA